MRTAVAAALAGVLAATISVTLAPTASAAGGDWDTTFAGTGYVVRPVGDNADTVAVAVHRGLTYVAYTFVDRRGATVLRYTPNGTLDPTWSGDGELDLAFSPLNIQVQAMRGGALVVGGLDRSGNVRFVRLTTAGTWDRTFGRRGRAVVPVRSADNPSTPNEEIRLARDHAGNILAAMTTIRPSNSNKRDVTVVRVTPSGQLDGTFADDGYVRIHTKVGNQVGWLGVDGRDRVVVAAETWTYNSPDVEVVVRLTADGRRDTAFGGTGRVNLSMGGGRWPVLSAWPDDKNRIVVAVNDVLDFGLFRLTSGGQRDLTFGSGGQVIYSGSGTSAVGTFVDGRFMLVTSYGDRDETRWLTREGTLDPTWGSAGVAVAASPTGNWFSVRQAAPGPDRTLMLVGADLGPMSVFTGRLTTR